MKRISIMMVVFMLAFTVCIPFASADDKKSTGSIMDEVKSHNLDTVVKDVDTATTETVKSLREIAIAVAVVMVILIAISWNWGRSEDVLSKIKVKAGILLVCFICIFFTEQIIGIFYFLSNR